MSDYWYRDKGRVVSVVIACGYIAFAFLFGESMDWLCIMGFVILPLALIWFGDLLSMSSLFTYLTPRFPASGIVFKVIGWVLLLSPVIFVIVSLLGKSLVQ